jgi:2-polyprenyl-3-methyl-5-hydroxy-6-metoxy-1,4-benzoquinol methylase
MKTSPTPASPAPRARKEIHPVVHQLIADLGVATGKKALDAPLGPGAMSFYLHQVGYEVTGLDMDLAQSAALPPAIARKACNLNAAIPLADATFDLVTSLEGIEHVENHFQLLRELGRVMKPGGHLIISTPNIGSLEERLKYLAQGTFYRFISRAEVDQHGSGFDHQNLIGYVELRQVLDWAGFKVERVVRDRIKWKQVILLSPFWLVLKAYLGLQSANRKARYLLSETGSNVVLLGGNTLIVQARKT